MSKQLQGEIDSIKQQLLSKYQPERIILFGSAIQENSNPNDLDFLIIKNDIPQKSIDRTRQVRKIINKTVAADFLILKSKELANRLELGDPMINNIMKFGRILYG